VDLTSYIGILRRNVRLLALVVVVCVLGAAAAAWLQTPLYTATSTFVATVEDDAGVREETVSRQLTAQRAATLAQFATTGPVQQAAFADASEATVQPDGPTEVEASADGSAPFLSITVTSSSAEWAQAVANAYGSAMPGALTSIDPDVASAARQLNVLTPAGLPGQPSSPDRARYLLMGLLLGLVLGAGAVVLRESLDRQVAEPEDVGRALALPVLGAVPSEDPQRLLPMRSAPHSARAEAYRAVLANLPFLNNAADLPQSVMITGSSSGEGVSTLAANLAVALARGGRRVLLVDANLRNPRLHEIFDVPSGPGLAEVLAGQIAAEDATHLLDGGSLSVMTAGALPEDPVERLTSARATQVLAHLGKECDVVVFDTPPVLPMADALFLVRHVSAAVLTARVGATKKDDLRRAGDALYQVRAPLVGVVVNGTSGRARRLRPSRRHGEEQPSRQSDNVTWGAASSGPFVPKPSPGSEAAG
jgi:succinoglycan biosynthesis transport protein ExoP